MPTRPPLRTRLWRRAHAPVDGASVAALRVLLGAIFTLSALRFIANGWVERFFVEPSFYFTYEGFGWVQPLAPWAMYAAFWAIAVLGATLAAGLFTRVSAALLFVVFTYVELIDVTNYLNHYYLLSLLALLCAALPAVGCVASIDARRRPDRARDTVPAWVLWLLRFQVGAVYVFAALAKAGPDWLLHGQPLDIWLSSRTDAPIIGPLLDATWAPLALSWAGFLHDLLIVPALLWRRTRWVAYGALVTFHVATGLLFDIGMFPVIMIASATILLPPDWPRRLARRLRPRASARPPTPAPRPAAPPSGPWARLGAALVIAWCGAHALLPLRAHLYGGDVLWHEQGMRWSWRVMVREKNGAISYRVKVPGEARERRVPPSRFLTDHQAREMSGQPDLIVKLAHHIARQHRAAGRGDVEVRVDALASLNGRPPAPLIDPEIDLTRVAPGLAAADWILPAPTGPPPRLAPARDLAGVAAEGDR